MTDRELFEKALEALNHVNVQDRVQIITALRERLAQPEQEPVAWLSDDGNVLFGPGPKGKYTRPLYTAPQPRQWQGLTDDEIAKITVGFYGSASHHDDYKFARAIEAKLKEKNA